jgi:nicotinamidase-related amidase
MTTLPDRPNTALVIVDVQRDVVANAHERDKVIANIADVLRRARDAGAPVIWVQHADDELVEGSEGWRYVDELQRDDAEPLVHKHFGDSFEETELEALLAERKVGHLVVAGAQTDACIRSTLHGALVRGYDATLVEDAHTTDDPSQWGAPLDAAQVIAHTNMYWKWQTAPGRVGGTVPTAEVAFRSPGT